LAQKKTKNYARTGSEYDDWFKKDTDTDGQKILQDSGNGFQGLVVEIQGIWIFVLAATKMQYHSLLTVFIRLPAYLFRSMEVNSGWLIFEINSLLLFDDMSF
jgi:hypothetical protein